MNLYIVVYISLCLICIMSLLNKKEIYLKIGILILFFVSVLRWETGTDWLSYTQIFKDMNNWRYFNLDVREIGYKTLTYIIRYFTDNFTYYLIIWGSILWWLKYENLKRMSPIPMLTLIIQYANVGGDIFFVRQNIAVGICLYASKYIQRKELLKYIIVVLLAGLVHKSALIVLILYPICNVNITLKFFLVAYYSIFILKIVLIKILEKILLSFNIFFKITKFIQSENLSIISISDVFKTLIITILFFLIIRYSKENKREILYFKIFILGSILSEILSTIDPILGRVSNYFSIYLYLLITCLFIKIKGRKNLIFCTLISLFLMGITLKMWKYHRHAELYLPYISIFEKEGIERKINL